MAGQEQDDLTTGQVVGKEEPSLDFFHDAVQALLDSNGPIARIFKREISDRELVKKAVSAYLQISELPICDYHTHYSVEEVVNKQNWDSPTAIFLGKPSSTLAETETNSGFDHYIAQIMNWNGVPPFVVYGRIPDGVTVQEFEKTRFTAMIDALLQAKGSDVLNWLEISLRDNFDVETELSVANVDAIWDELSEKIKSDKYSPVGIFNASRVTHALTTDDPTSNLDSHGPNEDGPTLIPTFRPDNVLMLKDEGRYAFGTWLQKLEAVSSLDKITTLVDFKAALLERYRHFKDNGCVATDMGIPNFLYDSNVTEEDAAKIFQNYVQTGNPLDADQMRKWQTYMLKWIMLQNAKHGFRQYVHQGPTRDANQTLFEEFGPDIGGDGPGQPLDLVAMTELFRDLNARKVDQSVGGTGLAPTIIFPLREEAFGGVRNIMGAFQSNAEGIKLKIQLGIPWWFQDNFQDILSYLKTELRAGRFSNLPGMLSDGRKPPSVAARYQTCRAAIAILLATEFPDNSVEEIVEMAKPLCYDNAMKFLGLDE